MKKIKLIYADGDQHYRKAFSEYILENNNEDFEMISFSKEEYLQDYLKENNDVDFVLVSEGMLKEKINTYANYAELSETKKEEGTTIYKYQPADNIVVEILEAMKKNINDVAESNAKVLCIYSPYSAVKKHEVTQEVITDLSEKTNSNLLYLNLDPITSKKIKPEEKGMSNLFYDLRNKEEIKLSKHTVDKINPLIKTINSFNNFLEYEEITKEDIDKLIEKIKQTDLYKYCIIELPSGFTPMVKRAIKQTDQTFFASSNKDRLRSQEILENIGLNPENTEIAKKMSIVKYDNILERIEG